MSKPIAIIPRISEKTYAQSEQGTYTFNVPLEANINDVKAAVEQQFKVTVTDVRTLIVKGKTKRSARRRAQPSLGQRQDVKKAYVTLKKGETISVFEELK